GSVDSYFTRNRKIEVPPDVMRKREIYDSLQNIKIQEQNKARNDSMARISARDEMNRAASLENNSPTSLSSTDSLTMDRRGQSAEKIALATEEPDTVNSNIKAILKDTVREKMVSSLRADKIPSAPAKEVKSEPEIIFTREQKE